MDSDMVGPSTQNSVENGDNLSLIHETRNTSKLGGRIRSRVKAKLMPNLCAALSHALAFSPLKPQPNELRRESLRRETTEVDIKEGREGESFNIRYF